MQEKRGHRVDNPKKKGIYQHDFTSQGSSATDGAGIWSKLAKAVSMSHPALSLAREMGPDQVWAAGIHINPSRPRELATK